MTNAETEESKAVIKPVKGTLTLHAISTDNHVNLIKRNPTCAVATVLIVQMDFMEYLYAGGTARSC
jgi:hypothetical protein